MWGESVILLSIFQFQSTFADVITGIYLNRLCTGSLTITHYETNAVLHKINNTALNIVITSGTRVVVKQTGNCCHHVFNRRNCKGESILVKNNEGSEIGANKHSGALSVVRFDAGGRGCNRVSGRYTKALCKIIQENEVEHGKLHIDNEASYINNYHNVSIQGDIYNVSDVNNETVIINILDTAFIMGKNVTDVNNNETITNKWDADPIMENNVSRVIKNRDTVITSGGISEGLVGSGEIIIPTTLIPVLAFLAAKTALYLVS